MDSNRSSTSQIIRLAAFGLALVAAGVGLYRRRRVRSAAFSAQAAPEDEAGAGGREPLAGEGLPDGQEIHTPEPSSVPPGGPSLKPFFLTVFGLSIPFWLFGGKPLPLPIQLPASALIAFVPAGAASILTCRRAGAGGVRELFQRAFDFKKIKNTAWYLPILLLMPAIYFLSYVLLRWTGGSLPGTVQIPLRPAPVFLVLFFITAVGEELGWMGYAYDPMQARWGALKAALLLGLAWALIHLPGDVQNGRPASWIVWQRLYSIALRILIAWIYTNTGRSVSAAVLVHTTDNLSWALFPNYGSHYNPFLTALLTWLAAAVVVIGWGPKTLGRFRYT